MQLSTDKMIAQVDGNIGWMIFNNPEKRNAFTHEMREAALAILAAFEKDERVRVVIMRGAGEHAFISGADINQFDKSRTAEPLRVPKNISDELRQCYDHYSKPIIAMIHGYCLGGGLLTAMAVDMRIASEDAQFGIPAGRLGIAYPLYGVRKLVQLVGPAKAKEILFTARRVKAQEALQIGLVNQVVPRSELEKTVRAIAQDICENAPLSIRASKVMIDELMKDAAECDLAACDAVQSACMESEDFREGRKAFAEKRKPQFFGR